MFYAGRVVNETRREPKVKADALPAHKKAPLVRERGAFEESAADEGKVPRPPRAQRDMSLPFAPVEQRDEREQSEHGKPGVAAGAGF